MIRDDSSPVNFIVELTSGAQDGLLVMLEKANCRNLGTGEPAIDLPDEAEPGEGWKD